MSRSDAAHAALHAPFRPRLARAVCHVLTVAVLLATGYLALLLPTGTVTGYTLVDRVGFALFGLGIAWFLHRQATVRAVPDESGITVRNLVYGRRLEWPQIISVRFGERPWVQLDLSDGDTLSVMGIQRADGAYAAREARRLATLVVLHTPTPRHD